MSTDNKKQDQKDKAVKDSKAVKPKESVVSEKVEAKKPEAKKPEAKKPAAKKPAANAAGSEKDAEQSSELKHVLSGEVVSAKMDKTIVVLMERKIKHPIYGKYIKKSSKFFVHDESNKSKLGDVVKFKASRPYSKNKTWVLVD